MDGLAKTIAGRMTLAVFVVHLVILPVLYLVIVALAYQSNEDQFINYVRGYTRFVADSLERVSQEDGESQIADILDGFMLSGTGVVAEIESGQQIIRGTIEVPSSANEQADDFVIGEHDDEIYNTSTPLILLGSEALLRLGFDERPIIEQNRSIYVASAVVLAIYLSVVLVLVALIGRRVTRPIRALQDASRKVASGRFLDSLTVDSDLVEFVELSNDLELMRRKLTGVNRQLQKEIRDRIKAEEARKSLESQLRHKQRLETVGTLAGGIAHELNNILVPILLYSEMAIEDLSSDSLVREDLLRVVKSAIRAKLIVSQVLTFSRQIDDTELEPIDIVESIKESIDLMRPAMPPDILLTKNIVPGEAVILADKSSLGQLIVNLLTNAYQSMLDSGGTLDVSLDVVEATIPISTFQAELPTGSYYILSVTDTGTGIDTNSMDRIFEPFYSTRKVGQGTGLGLSVVHGIVSSLNGGITVSSNADSGSSFVVYLPVAGPGSDSPLGTQIE